MITYRLEKGTELSHIELDNNFKYPNYWRKNKEYKYAMLVLYDNIFYTCKFDHFSTDSFDNTKWEPIGATINSSGGGGENIKYFWKNESDFNNLNNPASGELGVKIWEIGRPVYIYNSNTWVAYIDSNTNEPYLLDGTASNISYNHNSHNFQSIKDALDFLLYEPLSVSFSGGGVFDKGQVINSPIFNWNITGGNAIVSQIIKLNGTTLSNVPLNLTSIQLNNQGISTNKTYTLTVSDDTNTINKNTSFTFLNRLYYGSNIIPSQYDSSFLLSLSNNVLKSNSNHVFTVNGLSGEYIWFATPNSYNTPTFYAGGFEGGFNFIQTISFTNQYGHTTDYDIYRSEHPSLGVTNLETK